MQPTVDIIIVNWNAGRQLYNCLASIVVDPGFKLNRIIVVDNGSTDGSLEGLEKLELPLAVARNATNLGFGSACNQGAMGSTADYLLFLNPDTVLARDSISSPVIFMEEPSKRSIGIVGIQLVDANGVPHPWCCRFPTPRMFLNAMTGLARINPERFPGHMMTEWPHGESRDVDHVIGAFYLIRRTVFNDLHGFDDRFFVYMEDLDLSLRAKQAGWRSRYLTDSRAYHKGGGTSEQIKAIRLFYALRSRTQYSYKHFGFAPATVLLVATIVLEPFTRLAWALMRGSGREIFETVEGMSRLVIWIGFLPFRGLRR